MAQSLEVRIHREPSAADLPLPSYATGGSVGMDLYAALEGDLTLRPGARAQIPTGLRLALPDGYEAQIRPRSGLALRHGIGMVNAPGTIDTDYRGEVSVLLINWGDEPVTLRRGDRIAQMVVAPVVRVRWSEVALEALPVTRRHEGGFGHTGID